jgi:two-component system, chemotaxis family, chemotaxis protein CheY
MARIMISDDSDAIRMVLKDMLILGVHEVVAEATNGIETIEVFENAKPDLLLLDIAMPKKDGKTALVELISAHPDAKVVMITASDNMNAIKECLQHGAVNYILKPFDADELLKVVSEILKTK